MQKKYELIRCKIKGMFQIRALTNFSWIEAGDLGGYIESEKNLSHIGAAWVSGNARVYGNAQVYGDAWVYGNAQVYDNAHVSGDARVYGNALVYGDAQVSGDAQVYDNAQVSGNARVSGNAWVYGNAQVSGDARVFGDAWVYGDAWVSGDARVYFKYQCISVTNLNWSFTSLPKGIQIGCHFHTMGEWKLNYAEIGKENGLSKEQSKAYYELMKAVRRIQRLESKKCLK